MSFRVYVRSIDYPTQSPTNLVATFNPEITFTSNKPYEVALVGGKITNALPNLSVALGNNTIRYSMNGGTTWKTIVFPDGCYDTTALTTEIQSAFDTNGDYTTVSGVRVYPIEISAALYLDRAQVTLLANVNLDLSIGGFSLLLGFPATILTGGTTGGIYTAPNAATFTNISSNFLIYTDIISDGVRMGNILTSGILKIFDGGSPGYPISLYDNYMNFQFFPVMPTRMTSLRMRVLDNNGNVADLRGEQTAFELLFRPIDPRAIA